MISDIKTEKDYVSHIYSSERMNNKLHAMQHITIPSIKAQSYKNLEWYIYTSPKVPSDILNRLHELLRDSRFHIKVVADDKECRNDFSKQLKKYKKYISVRLDDDDGFHPQYFDLLSRSYSPGRVLNPRHGLKIKLSEDLDTMRYVPLYRKFAASGLGFAQGNVYSLGNHTKINSKIEPHNIISFSQHELLLYSVHGSNITGAGFINNDPEEYRSLREYLSQRTL